MASPIPRYRLIGLLGLIGYLLTALGIILGVIPFTSILGLIGMIIAGTAWFVLGVDLRDNYYKALGVILITSTSILFTMIYIWTYTMVLQLTSDQHILTNEEEVLRNFMDQVLLLTAVFTLIIWPIEALHIVGHFKAERDLGIKLFKHSAIVRLLSLIFNMTSTLLLVQNIYSNKQEILKIIEEISRYAKTAIPERVILELTKIMGLPLTLALIASMTMVIASILSATSFNKLRRSI